ncbi:MAG: proline dehydrogenase family protein [Candidatus Eremiobacteraeota bacterium]|nr:proline dehydrogenase family protein [Candidatus Eremiobacteraeota bacterium]
MAVIDRLLAPNSTFQRRFFFLAKRFVAGETIVSALEAVRRLNDQGITATLDFLGEDVFERDAALHTRDVYFEMLDAIGRSGLQTNVSIKLTAMGLLIDEDFAAQNLLAILERAQRNSDPFVRIDMEGSAVTASTLDVFERVFSQQKNVGPVFQAYLKRTPGDVERAIELSARVRLCKGAYSEPAAIAIKEMPLIREQYMLLAKQLLSRGNYPGIATHDLRLIEAIKIYVKQNGISSDRFEFQMLYGIRPEVQRTLIAQGYRLRVYIPFGTHWAGYFYRRILERKENALFALSSMFMK